jgi:hypothetical protein
MEKLMNAAADPRFDAHGDPTRRLLETWLELWAAELGVWGFWQQTLLGMQRSLFDQWACRFAGGIPIDG